MSREESISPCGSIYTPQKRRIRPPNASTAAVMICNVLCFIVCMFDGAKVVQKREATKKVTSRNMQIDHFSILTLFAVYRIAAVFGKRAGIITGHPVAFAPEMHRLSLYAVSLAPTVQ